MNKRVKALGYHEKIWQKQVIRSLENYNSDLRYPGVWKMGSKIYWILHDLTNLFKSS